MPFLMTIFAQCNKIFGFIATAVTYEFDMMDIKISVIYRYVNSVFILKRIKLSAVLASEIIPIKYAQ